MNVDLAAYDNRGYHPGAGLIKRSLWFLLHALAFNSRLVPGSAWRCALLRLFGARVGQGVVIKPQVAVKYPWFLEIGDHVWLGEGAWIDNLAPVRLDSHVCISQGAYLLTGNHDYRDPAFGLMVAGIQLGEGAWVGARAIVCPGVSLGRGAVLSAGSVLSGDAQAHGVYRGNPAQWVRHRGLEGDGRCAG